MISLEKYKEVPFKDPSDWFIDLIELANTCDNNSDLPRLELLLNNGKSMYGYIIKARQNKDGHILMIIDNLDEYDPKNITLISTCHVIGMTFVDVDKYLHLYTNIQSPEPIGNLELKRQVRDINSELETIFSTNVKLEIDTEELENDDRWYLLKTIELLPSIFKSIASDSIGENILKENIEVIQIIKGDKISASLSDKILKMNVMCPFSGLVADEKAKLKNEIEGAL